MLSAIPVKDEEDAIRIANDSNYGLGAGIQTSDVKLAHRVAKALPAGAVVVVNQPDLVAWYAGSLSGAAERRDGKVTVTATEVR